MKKLQAVRNFGTKAALAIGSTLAAGAAFAASTPVATDLSSAVQNLSGVSDDVKTIGFAVLGILIVAAGFKYLRRTI